MNMEQYNALSDYWKSKVDLLSEEEKNEIFRDDVIPWSFVYRLRESYIALFTKKKELIIPHSVLQFILYTIDEFIDAFMQVTPVVDIGFEYDEIEDKFILYYVPVEESEENE